MLNNVKGGWYKSGELGKPGAKPAFIREGLYPTSTGKRKAPTAQGVKIAMVQAVDGNGKVLYSVPVDKVHGNTLRILSEKGGIKQTVKQKQKAQDVAVDVANGYREMTLPDGRKVMAKYK